jgi:starch phosphorylase
MDRYVPLPPLPDRISRLNEVAYDLWWSWSARAREVFRTLDYPLWRFTDHNPVLLLHLVEADHLEFAASDPEFLKLYDEAVAELDVIRAGAGTWWAKQDAASGPIAWIAPQFALHQSLPVHATAEGVISGDVSKEASDLGVPFVGIGLMYTREYPHQRMTADGWQEERIEYVDWSDAPIGPALSADGTPCSIAVPIGSATVHAAVWQVRAGRATVYLLDTEVDENAPWDRVLSGRRAADDPDTAFRRAVLLGAGAVAVLRKLRIEPAMWRLAGGHAAAVVLERVHALVAEGRGFDEALAAVRATTVFAARSDAPSADAAFTFAAVERCLSSTWPALAPHRDAVLALGRHADTRGETFNGSVLGARATAAVDVAAEGVHLSTWISADLARLLDEWLGAGWRDTPDDEAVWGKLADVPDAELWAVRQRLRGYLVDFMRERARRRWAKEQAGGPGLVSLGTLLDGGALTIGCVPRCDEDVPLDTLFKDVERLARIATDRRHPVQFVFAGRADRGDERAKYLLQRIWQHTRDAAFGGRLAFLEDYDLHVARLMVQGCDAWLTLPPYDGGPPLGAVKAAVNGGWHLEAVQPRALYARIEDEIVPAFYSRDRAGVPAAWASIMRETLIAALPRFSARTAVKGWSARAGVPPRSILGSVG